MKNAENRASYPYDERKIRKITLRRGTTYKNQLSSTRENQKSAKISFPSWGKIRTQRKTAFPHGGKSEISKNRLSLMGENQKSAKISFPKLGKNKKTPLAPFPIPQKDEKPRKFDKTTFGGQFTFCTLSFGIYRPDDCCFPFFFSLEMTLYSEGDMP